MMLLKSGDQLRQNKKKLVATDKDDQLRIGWIAVPCRSGTLSTSGTRKSYPFVPEESLAPLLPMEGCFGVQRELCLQLLKEGART
jgi:hypothetical protein